ncbi:MAG: biotin--[acetyl-CoA-carboxylase] ligase [Methanocalculus sp.]|uniref:biotin--[acetyl-CoA-carboxylase] ligase n=1 Tax=Methanocalculus sp. TaxID=2004547 RepID=UPI00271E6E4E|nr:biotin--[acetyl-CoA-carboxylase] ligase [Methanocalculus sp.]MDO8841621.1 biotin--[acetyl-CoA-carboxylase] ligase [Methanocalculus sp.]MDO9540638.1 biotin--[acetyl-CoA-carboxylase] ligase [Methanocalculus sp.]
MTSAAFNVLKILDRHEEKISGEKISEELGISRSAVWKHIEELRHLGYEIEASPKEGYHLIQRTTKLLPYEIKRHLRTKRIGSDIHYVASTPSTIWLGKQMIREIERDAGDGLVIIAEEQTGGIGRLGRSWASPFGGIWTTIVIRPSIPISSAFMIMMAASVAVARAIRKEYDIGALIKWPNDIFIGDKKVAGMHLELSAEADVIHYCLLSIGIDVNVSVAELMPVLNREVTSISEELGYEVDRAKFLARLLTEFERRYTLVEKNEYEALTREWKSLSCTLEHRVEIRTLKKTFEGEAIDIDDHGALIIRKDNGKIERVIAGDCHIL